MNSTRPIGATKIFSPEAVNVNLAFGLLVDGWEIKHKWTKILGERSLAYRIRVGWIGKQGIVTGLEEIKDAIMMSLAPTFSGVDVRTARVRELTDEDVYTNWEFSIYITWTGYFRPEKVATLTVDEEERQIWKDSNGKAFYCEDYSYPSIRNNYYIERIFDKLISTINYEDGLLVEEL